MITIVTDLENCAGMQPEIMRVILYVLIPVREPEKTVYM